MTEILTMPEIDTDQRVITDAVEDIDRDNEDDNLRHIVRPADNPHAGRFKQNPKGQDVVDICRIRGLEVTTLCGKTMIPKNNGDGRDTCDTCIGMAGIIKGGS